METIASDAVKIKALATGVNLTQLGNSMTELEAACNRKIEAAEDFKNMVQVVALSSGVLPGVLSQYIVARCTDSVRKKAQSAEQLSLLFVELA